MPEVRSNLQGRFLLRKKLGAGGMAEVWHAYDSRLGVWRAVKVLLPEYARRTKLRKRFETEARAMALLEHPNIVRIYDVGSEGDQSWIVMELCEGGTLESWLRRNGPMPPRLAVDVTLQVVAGIAHAHANNIVHRDVKPQNILITAKGTVKLTDFGIAHFEDDAHLTRTGTVMGTLGYMAPEQRSDAKKVDRRTDIYAVGATLFTLLTGRIEMDLFAAAQDPALFDSLPPAILPLIRKTVAYHRDERYQSMTELAAALEAVRAELPARRRDEPTLVPTKIDRPPPPSVVEQALAEAAITASEAPPIVPGETVLPSDDYDLFEGTSIPPSLRKAAEAQSARRTPAPPAISTPSPRASTPPGAPEPLVSEEVGSEPPRRPREALPWVPPGQRGGPSHKPGFDFESLYVQESTGPVAPEELAVSAFDEPSHAVAPRQLSLDAPTPPSALSERATEDMPPLRRRRPRREPSGWLGDAWWEARQFLRSPIKAVPTLLAIVLVVVLLSAVYGATTVVEAGTTTRTHLRNFNALVERNAASLIDDVAWAGGDRATLEAQWERYKMAWAPERQAQEGYALVRLVDTELARFEENPDRLRPTDVASLKRRIAVLSQAHDEYEGSRQRWTQVAVTPTGRLAVHVGLATPPP